MPRNGWSLIDSIVTLALLGITLSWAVAIAGRVVADTHTAAAAREFAVLFQALRWTSISENRHVGLFFEPSGSSWQWWKVRDGNGNGLRSAEIRNGTDVKTSGPHRLEASHRGTHLGFPAGWSVPGIPPRRGVLDVNDPIRFGRCRSTDMQHRGTA